MREIINPIVMILGVWLVGQPAQHSVLRGADSVDNALQLLSAADSSNHPAADAKAWSQIAQAPPKDITRILSAMDRAKPLAANWLRGAVDTIAERALANNLTLPVQELVAFIRETTHDPLARSLAYDWLRKVDPQTADRLIPSMLHDRSVDLRRESVALRMSEAKRLEQSNEPEAAIKTYREALDGARDEDQVKELAKSLGDLGQKLDLPQHFGFLQTWKVIAPFPNLQRGGLEIVYPPETEIKLDAEYPGKDGQAAWKALVGEDDFGMIDLNKPFGPLKEVVGYAWTEFQSEKEQEVELRLGCKNAWTLWVNGEQLFSRNEYHRGMQMDQYRIKANLKQGRNEILLKLCQNEQTESWTVEWQFQLRVCDSAGTAILSSDRATK